MTILMLSEYFPPYDFGGSEWSVFYLAKGLKKMGYKAIILTPNYGNKKYEDKSGFKIIRFPFYKKLKKNQLAPFWQTNSLWIIWTSICVLYFSIKTNADVIHVQGKYFLPAAIIAKFLTRKKVVTTLRDYIVLCPLGMCILKSGNKCTLKEFLFEDIPMFLKIYKSKSNIFVKSLYAMAAIRGKIVSQFLFFLLQFSDEVVLLSRTHKKVYGKSKISNLWIIPNSVELVHKARKTRSNSLIYAGRFTPGKGVELLIPALKNLFKEDSTLKLFMYGSGFLKDSIRKKIKDCQLTKNVILSKKIPHNILIKKIATSKLVVIPSIWPEPYGRLAAESLAVGTPIVLTTKVGAADYVKKGKWGLIVKPAIQEIERAVAKALSQNKKLRSNILKDQPKIKHLFIEQTLKTYINVYKQV